MINTRTPFHRISARLLGVSLAFAMTISTGTALAQKGSGGGGGNQTVATFLSAVPVLDAGLGSSTTDNLTLADVGSAPLTIATLALTGVAAPDYRLGGTCAAGVVLQRNAPANTCLLQITFTPTVLGRRTATLSVTFANAPALSLSLTGNGLPPGPVFTYSAIGNPVDFGSKAVGSAANSGLADTTVTISNPGAQTLTGSFTFTGSDAADFVFGSAGARTFNCPANIALGPPPSLTSCQLGITFVPTASGVRAATLHITTNDPANPATDIALTGVGTSGAVQPPPPPPITSAADFTDLWGTTSEPAWTLQITHHKSTSDALLAFWHTFDANGQPIWLELTDGHWVDSLTYTGNLHQSLGPSFAGVYDPSLVSDAIVGTATLTFSDAANGTFSYTVNNVMGSKAIVRRSF